MPIFEYACLACGKKFAALVGVVAQNANPSCPRCGDGDHLQKKVSRFARVRTEDDRMESLADDADLINPDDPRAVRSLLHAMAGSMGDDMDAGDMEQLMDEATGTNDTALFDPMED